MKIKDLSDRNKRFRTGYLIVEDKIMKFEKESLEASFDVEGDTPMEKVKYFKKNYKNEIDSMPRVIYNDDEEIYQAWLIESEGRLVTEEYMEEEEVEDMESYMEYCFNH